jgi:hypothetical protein
MGVNGKQQHNEAFGHPQKPDSGLLAFILH